MVQTRLLGTTSSLWPLEYICSIFVVWWSGRLSTSLQGFWTPVKSIWASLGRVPFAFCLSRSWGREGERSLHCVMMLWQWLYWTRKIKWDFPCTIHGSFSSSQFPSYHKVLRWTFSPRQRCLSFLSFRRCYYCRCFWCLWYNTHTVALSLYNEQKHRAFVHLALTFSTSLNTRRKLCLRTPDNSFSVQCLFSSSWIRAGYLDTSSNPRGNLQTVEHNRLCITQTLRPLKMQLLSVTSLLKKWVILIAFKLEHNMAVLMNQRWMCCCYSEVKVLT